jgi:hypothetical protein
MKIYIYHDLFNNSAIVDHNKKLADAHNLHQQFSYLVDIYEYFKGFETTDLETADYFFVPIFLAGWQFVNHDPFDIMKLYCKCLYRGNHIIVGTGDFGQRSATRNEMDQYSNPHRAYSEKYLWLDQRFVILALESTSTLLANDIAFLPYPRGGIRSVSDHPRDIVASFVGKVTQPVLPASNIRSSAFDMFRKNLRNEDIVILEASELRSRYPENPSTDAVMQRSLFVLCPEAYGRWTYRFMEALANGAIPLLLSDDYVLPFESYISWDRYIYRIPEKELFNLEYFIKSLDLFAIFQKLRNIKNDRHLFLRAASLEFITQKLEFNVEQNKQASSPSKRAISKMRPPSDMHIICIDVTNKCDLSCSNCTRLLENQDSFWEMSPENFRLALRSMKNYKGMIAIIGGNPCMHSRFTELCDIFVEEVPNQQQRGLWTNSIFKYGDIIERVFGGLNLNTHNNVRSVDKLTALYQRTVLRGGYNGGLYLENSEHAPILTAIQDLTSSDEEMWHQISNCDINREWSATIIQNKGELRAYFCEVAASFDLARNQDHGMVVELDWWRKPLMDFESQIVKFCPGCGVPARTKGHLDFENTDTYTDTNSDIALGSQARKKRKIVYLNPVDKLPLGHKVTKYSSNSA